MPEIAMPQPSSADTRRSFSQGHLTFASVPAAADQSLIATSVLGSVLTWPGMVLAYHFGTTKSSATK
jgi:hypothetical protein